MYTENDKKWKTELYAKTKCKGETYKEMILRKRRLRCTFLFQLFHITALPQQMGNNSE